MPNPAPRLLPLSPLLFLSLILSPTLPAARADDTERRRDTARLDQARRDYDAADSRWRTIRRNLDDAEAHLQHLRQRERDLPNLIEASRRAAEAAVRDIDAAEDAQARAQDHLAAAARAYEEKQPPVAAAEQRASAAKRAADDLRATQLRTFEASKPFLDATAAHQAATDHLRATTQSTLDALSKTPKYLAAKLEADTAESKVTTLRKTTPIGDKSLAEASTVWLNAKSALKKLETDTIAKDEKVLESRDALAAADTALVQLKGQFERVLAATPAMQAAKQNVTTEHTRLAAAKADLQKTEHDRNSAARALARARDNTALAYATQKRHTNEQVARNAELRQIRTDLAIAEQSVDRLRDDERRALADRDSAEAALRRAERDARESRDDPKSSRPRG